MKALVYTTQAKMDGRKVIEPGKCELLDIPEPQLLPTDDMKIRVDYCAMCATDVHIVTMGLYGMPAPWIMGHELCGTIVEVNPRATENGFAVGDKVVVNCTAPCGCCDECKRGHDIFCKHPIAGSFVHGFTEYCTAVCEQVFQIPKNSPIDPKYYCLAEPDGLRDGRHGSGRHQDRRQRAAAGLRRDRLHHPQHAPAQGRRKRHRFRSHRRKA